MNNKSMKYYNTCKLKLLLIFIIFLTSCFRGYQPGYVAGESSINLDNRIQPDSIIESMIQPYKMQLADELNEVIGYAPSTLTTRKLESSLGNFIVDLLREEARKHYSGKVDLAAITNGGIRIPIAKGDISLRDIFELMPFENNLLILTIDGSTAMKLFDYLAATRNISIANTEINIQGNRAVDILIGGERFNPDKTYTLAISDYLANGGDSMFFLKNCKRTTLNLKIRDAIIEYIKYLTSQGKNVEAKIEGRVRGVE